MTGAARTAWAALEGALRARQPVLVSYHGRERLVCPHALGRKAGRAMLLGYQTGGQTSTGALPADPGHRWRCFYVDELDQVVPVDVGSPWGTADNYSPSHPFPSVDEVTLAVPRDEQATDSSVR